MPEGMQVYDENNNLLIDTTTLVGNFINSFTTTARSGSISNSLFSTGTPFAFASPEQAGDVPDAPTGEIAPVCPNIEVNGNTLTWAFDEDTNLSVSPRLTIFYGVF